MSTDKKDKKETAPQEEEVKEETPKASEDVKGEDKKNAKKASKKKDSKKDEEKKDVKEDSKEEPKESKDDELAAEKDRYLRLYAEYDNFRRRSAKEKTELYADIKANTVKSFLPVYDNLERALKQETQDEAYKKGVEMIMAQFVKTLEGLGVSEIPDVGEKFDPNLHNAVMHVDDEEKGENEIVEVFQKGFRLEEKVIRFSMVKVAN